MANERLLDLDNPDHVNAFVAHIQRNDPVHKLHNTLLGDPELAPEMGEVMLKGAKKGLFPKADVPAVERSLAAHPQKIAEAAMKPLRDEIKALKDTLDGTLNERKVETFRSSLIAKGAEAGHVDEIVTFMKDNGFGPGDVAQQAAVDAYYRSKEVAEPNATGLGNIYEPPGSSDANKLVQKMLSLTGPGQEEAIEHLGLQLAEANFQELTNESPRRRSLT